MQRYYKWIQQKNLLQPIPLSHSHWAKCKVVDMNIIHFYRPNRIVLQTRSVDMSLLSYLSVRKLLKSMCSDFTSVVVDLIWQICSWIKTCRDFVPLTSSHSIKTALGLRAARLTPKPYQIFLWAAHNNLSSLQQDTTFTMCLN